MADLVQVWAAQSKAEARKAYAEADKQHEIVNEAYRKYHKAAMVVSKLFEANAFVIPKNGDPGYKEWVAAVAGKREANVAWQREAHKHGAMFVPLMDTPKAETNDSKEPW
jgi:hypothetical protein